MMAHWDHQEERGHMMPEPARWVRLSTSELDAGTCAGCNRHRPLFPAMDLDAHEVAVCEGCLAGEQGSELAAALRTLIDAVAPLMDPEYCQPFVNCWELDPYNLRYDGLDLHEQVEAAWQQAKAALDA